MYIHIQSGYGNPCKCPVCRQDIGGPLQRQQSHRIPTTTRSNITTRFINRLAVASAASTSNFFPNSIYNEDTAFIVSTHGRLPASSSASALINVVNDSRHEESVHYGTFGNGDGDAVSITIINDSID